MNDYFSASGFTFTPGTTARATTVTSALEGIEAGFDKLPDEAEVKLDTISYGTAGGTANAYTVTLPHPQIVYTDGMRVVFKPGDTNTGASTINVDSIGIKSITRTDGTALVAGDIVAGRFTELRYNSTPGNFEIVGMVASSAGTGTMAAQNASAVNITGGTIDGLTVVNLAQNYLQIGSTAVTLTAAELNQLDGVIVGGNSSGDLLTTDDSQDVSGKTLISPVLNTGVSGTAVLDEDTMVSDSATQLATQQSIKAYTDGKRSTYVNAADGGPYVSSSQNAITTTCAKDTWESYGPTGSGADNIWTALDNLPTGAGWVDVMFFFNFTASAGGAGSLVLSARKEGSSVVAANSQIAGVGVDASGYTIDFQPRKIPIDSNGVFELFWTDTNASSSAITATLVGHQN